MIPCFFAYDHTNYARYLPWYLINMQNLEVSHPGISQYLNNGGFSVQLSSENPFGKIPMDQTIEETVNKDTQTPGGTKGFSLKHGAVARYYVTADDKKECLRLLRAMVNSENASSLHHDLQKTRIERGEDDVKKVLQMFESTWKDPFEDQDLVNVSTGMIATPDVVNDLLNAYEKGKAAYDQFIDSRLYSNRNSLFFDTLHKLQLKTFGSMNKKIVNVKGKELVLTIDRNLFAKMAVVAQSRNLNMKDVLRYELGPFPWSIATCDGSLRKTNKETLSNNLENMTVQAENVTENSSTIIDAMAIIQKTVGTVNVNTFSDIAKNLFHKILSEGTMSNRIDVVFDTYKDLSIKNIERSRRGTESVTFGNILPGHKIKQFDKFLKSSASKMALIRFLADEWKKEYYRNHLVNKSFFISFENKCWKLTTDNIEDVPELFSDQEEADTRILLHTKHAYDEGCSEILLASEDTDVHVLGISLSTEISATIFQKCGTKNKSRIINLSFIKDVLSVDVDLSLPGLHVFTGCDSVSAFSGKGKLHALKLVKGSKGYQNAFNQLGECLAVPEQVEITLETFVCQLYGGKTSDVSDLRYLIFCAKNGNVGSNQLPPSKQSLKAHISRANYQTYIWKHSLVAQQNIADPIGLGWKIDDGQLVIDWGYERAAPDEILEFMSCQCKKKCTVESCCCASNQLNCTDV